MTEAKGQTADHSMRGFALVTGLGLLAMALLAPFAQFGVLQTLIVPADAAATTANILASAGIFRAAIAAFLIIAILDIVVAWGLYILLRPTNASLALLVAWLRVAYAAVFAYALVNLLDVAQLLQNTSATALSPVQVQAQVASSIASFNNGWDLALAIFGLPSRRPWRPAVQVRRLPEGPRSPRRRRGRRLPGRLIRDDPRPRLHADHQRLHVHR